jgi:hypothetical protein
LAARAIRSGESRDSETPKLSFCALNFSHSVSDLYQQVIGSIPIAGSDANCCNTEGYPTSKTRKKKRNSVSVPLRCP